MKLEIIPKDDTYMARVIYTKDEWERLQKIYETAGLEKRITNMGFGNNTLEYYRYPVNTTVFREVFNEYSTTKSGEKIRLVDDINMQLLFYDSDYLHFNLAIFRVIPKESGNSYVTEIYSDIVPAYKMLLKDIALILKIFVNKVTNSNVKVKYSFEVIY